MLLTLLAAAALVVAADTRSGDSTETRIAALADESFSRRQAAQKELIESGPVVVDRLKAALVECRDEEQRSSIELILKRIAEDSVLGPTRITLDITDAPITDAIAAINRQAGQHLLLFPSDVWPRESGPMVTLRVDRQPLWAVVRELCSQANLELTPTDDGIRLTPGCGAGIAHGPATVAGPVMIVASRIYHQRSIEFSQGNLRNSEFGLSLLAMAEPKIKLMPGAAALRLTEVVDDRGNSLLSELAANETYGGGSPYWTFNARLCFPANAGTKIAKLAGTLSFVAASAFNTVELTDLPAAQNVAVQSGQSRLIVRRITQTGERYDVSLSAIAPPGDTAEFNRLQQLLYSAELRLLDDKGQSILRSNGPNFVAADAPNALELSITFDRNLSDGRPAPGKATRLLWQIPTETRTIEVPFEMTNLPMP